MNIRQRATSTFTNAEFERLVRSGGFGDARVELRRGPIVKGNAQCLPHARAKWPLAKAIEAGLAKAGIEWSVCPEVSVDLLDGFQPLPDIVLYDPMAVSAEDDGPIPARAIRLLVAISDTTLADDLGEKLDDYAKSGVPEYWVADLKSKLILRHSDPSADGYGRREAARFGEVCTSLVYLALAVDTAALS